MGALQAKENIWYVGVQDPGLRVFDIIMHSDHGTSYNSYLVKGTEKRCCSRRARSRSLRSSLPISARCATRLLWIISSSTIPSRTTRAA